jgi:Sulfotransferase family
LPEPPVFVVGAQRSGTTIVGEVLARMLGSGLVVNGKLAYYLAVWLLENEHEWDGRHVRLDELAHALRRVPPRNAAPGAFEDAIGALLRQGPGICAASPSRAVAAARLWYAFQSHLAPGAAVLGEKYNELLLHLDALLSAFPNARIVFVFREPCDVSESMVRHFAGRPWAPATAGEAARKYVAWNAAWERARDRVACADRYELCYERFVERPAEVMEDCCRRLRLPAATFPELPRIDASRRGAGRAVAARGGPAVREAIAWYARACAGFPEAACAR